MAHGIWQPNRLGVIRALALDCTGQLWVAEGASAPKRISVWTTSTPEGQLVHDYFSPPDVSSPIAIHPQDPYVMFADGCEWRIDPGTGRAKCQGIITPDPMHSARFVLVGKNRVLLALTPMAGAQLLFERTGEGEYLPIHDSVPAERPPQFQLVPSPVGWSISTANGFILGGVFEHASQSTLIPPPGNDWPISAENAGSPRLTQTVDGRIFLTAGTSRVWNFELTGLKSLHPLKGGKFTIPDGSRAPKSEYSQ